MADLSTVQSSQPVELINETSGNTVVVNTDGSINVVASIPTTTTPIAANISAFTAAGKVFSVTISVNQTTAGTDNPLLLIKNPSGSGKTAYLYQVSMGVNVVNVMSRFKIYANPTITTNGTALSERNNLIGSGTTSALEAFSLPTISVLGSELRSYQYGQNNNSVESLTDFSIHIPSNNNLLLTGNPASNNREATITVVWAEV